MVEAPWWLRSALDLSLLFSLCTHLNGGCVLPLWCWNNGAFCCLFKGIIHRSFSNKTFMDHLILAAGMRLWFIDHIYDFKGWHLVEGQDHIKCSEALRGMKKANANDETVELWSTTKHTTTQNITADDTHTHTHVSTHMNTVTPACDTDRGTTMFCSVSTSAIATPQQALRTPVLRKSITLLLIHVEVCHAGPLIAFSHSSYRRWIFPLFPPVSLMGLLKRENAHCDKLNPPKAEMLPTQNIITDNKIKRAYCHSDKICKRKCRIIPARVTRQQSIKRAHQGNWGMTADKLFIRDQQQPEGCWNVLVTRGL